MKVLTLEVPLLHHLLGELLASSNSAGLNATGLELVSATTIVAAADKVEDSLTLSVLGTDVMARVGRDGGSGDGSEEERGEMHLDGSDQKGKIWRLLVVMDRRSKLPSAGRSSDIYNRSLIEHWASIYPSIQTASFTTGTWKSLSLLPHTKHHTPMVCSSEVLWDLPFRITLR